MRRPHPASPGDVRSTPRALTTVVAATATLLLALVAVVVPLPYAVERPGPTRDTLGEHDGEPLIEVEGARTYPTDGELRLTTVSVSGGPGYPVTAVDVLVGWVREYEVVEPVEAVYPEDRSREELEQESTAQMTSSQTNATVAALTELGYEVPATLVVASVAPDADAHGVLREDDIITAVQPAGGPRTQTETFADLTGVLEKTPPGTTVTLGVTRDGEAVEVEVETMAPTGPRGEPEEDASGSVLGVYLQPDLEVPVEVTIGIEDIGGPSAGLMFALGIVDVLTPGALTGGESIAGTGTMSLDGEVGTIGGVRQKLVGASRDGADWFLAPAGNCDEVVGYAPAGLQVVPVGTLAEARDAVEAIAAGGGAGLPTCAAP